MTVGNSLVAVAAEGRIAAPVPTRILRICYQLQLANRGSRGNKTKSQFLVDSGETRIYWISRSCENYPL